MKRYEKHTFWSASLDLSSVFFSSFFSFGLSDFIFSFFGFSDFSVSFPVFFVVVDAGVDLLTFSVGLTFTFGVVVGVVFDDFFCK